MPVEFNTFSVLLSNVTRTTISRDNQIHRVRIKHYVLLLPFDDMEVSLLFCLFLLFFSRIKHIGSVNAHKADKACFLMFPSIELFLIRGAGME